MDAVSNSRLNTFHNAHFDYTSIPTENSAIFVQCVKFHFRPNICSVNRYRFRFRYMRRVGYSEAVSLDRHSQSPVIFSPSVADPAGGGRAGGPLLGSVRLFLLTCSVFYAVQVTLQVQVRGFLAQKLQNRLKPKHLRQGSLAIYWLKSMAAKIPQAVSLEDWCLVNVTGSWQSMTWHPFGARTLPGITEKAYSIPRGP